MENNTKIKPKTRIRRKNIGYRKIIVFLVLIFILIQLLRVIVPTIFTYSRYMVQYVRGYYLGTKNFYFKSDKLAYSSRPKHFEAANWSGIDPYEITVRMNSIKNSEVKADMDINYTIELTYSVYKADGTEYSNPTSLVEVELEKENVTEVALPGNKVKYTTNGTIYVVANNQDYFSFKITKLPGVFLADNDYVIVNIKADSTYPFETSLAGDFKVSIGNLGMSYRIEDNEYDPYFRLIVTNTLDSYKVDQAFSYVNTGGATINCAVGDSISITDYLNCLTDAQRNNCHSMIVSLNFDPHEVLLDTASDVFVAAEGTPNIAYETIGSGRYVDFVKLKVAAEESKVIRFYKVDASENYSYQSGDLISENSIVEVTFE